VRTDDEIRDLLSRVAKVLIPASRKAKLLEAISWPRAVEDQFFAAGAGALPSVEYVIERDAANTRIASLRALESTIAGDDALATWLRNTTRAFIDGNRLLLAVGTAEFHRLSSELYGSARTPFLGGGSMCNLDLAVHLEARLRVLGWDDASDPDEPLMRAHEFVENVRERLRERTPHLEIDVALDERCTAKVQAGRSRVRVRHDATFRALETESLWVHEVETHALTAQNGAAQPHATFLVAGGPRSTRTQEGLAIFAELYEHSLGIARMERLALRVKLVDMAESGASFLELYRHLLGLGSEPRDAYLDAQRICRGGRVEGGAPFTKDACYLAGLLDVYTFLAALTRGGLRDEVELVVAGRLSLDDIPALIELRQRGIVDRPRYLPHWLRRWDGLLPYFAFTSFVGDVALSHVEDRYQRVLELAARQTAPDKPRS